LHHDERKFASKLVLLKTHKDVVRLAYEIAV
jgi:hypothetical protein